MRPRTRVFGAILLAAIAVGHAIGISIDDLRRALRSFRGVRRRLELRGTVRGVAVYDDFAHHPTAILETLRAVRLAHPGQRIWAVFEPRSATSCRRVFQQDFARAFAESGADEIVLASVFRASLPPDERLSVDEPSTTLSLVDIARVTARRRGDRADDCGRSSTATSWSSCRTADSTTSTKAAATARG
jgi:UDP-N-acetylmuramate-alanine ligase